MNGQNHHSAEARTRHAARFRFAEGGARQHRLKGGDSWLAWPPSCSDGVGISHKAIRRVPRRPRHPTARSADAGPSRRRTTADAPTKRGVREPEAVGA